MTIIKSQPCSFNQKGTPIKKEIENPELKALRWCGLNLELSNLYNCIELHLLYLTLSQFYINVQVIVIGLLIYRLYNTLIINGDERRPNIWTFEYLIDPCLNLSVLNVTINFIMYYRRLE